MRRETRIFGLNSALPLRSVTGSASQVLPLSMASMEQAFFSSAVKVLAPAAVAAVWVDMGDEVRSYLLRVIGEEEEKTKD